MANNPFPALRRAWDRITTTRRAISDVVPPPGDIWTTDDGRAYVGDGSTALRALAALARTTDAVTPQAATLIAAQVVAQQAVSDAAAFLAKPSGGSTGQALVKQADGTAAWATVAGGSSSIALDTDGVPYYSPGSSTAIALDTDGVPYLAA